MNKAWEWVCDEGQILAGCLSPWTTKPFTEQRTYHGLKDGITQWLICPSYVLFNAATSVFNVCGKTTCCTGKMVVWNHPSIWQNLLAGEMISRLINQTQSTILSPQLQPPTNKLSENFSDRLDGCWEGDMNGKTEWMKCLMTQPSLLFPPHRNTIPSSIIMGCPSSHNHLWAHIKDCRGALKAKTNRKIRGRGRNSTWTQGKTCCLGKYVSFLVRLLQGTLVAVFTLLCRASWNSSQVYHTIIPLKPNKVGRAVVLHE